MSDDDFEQVPPVAQDDDHDEPAVDAVSSATKKRRNARVVPCTDDEDESEKGSKKKEKKACVTKQRLYPGDKADCEGHSVPDGYLYHVVGAVEQDQGPARLIVKPGAPPCWTTMNIGFFVGRHVAKLLPNVSQYACGKRETLPPSKKEPKRTIPARCPALSSYVWPVYEVDFDDSSVVTAPVCGENAPESGEIAPLLSQLYTSLVIFGSTNIAKVANYLRSDATDFGARTEMESADDFVLDVFIGDTGSEEGALLELERDIKTPLLLATHCLILDRDVQRDPGPAKLIDSIPPIMRYDGLPDAITLTRWMDLTRLRCQTINEPLLAWGASNVQFGSDAHARFKSLWDLVQLQADSSKSRSRAYHDVWIENSYRVASLPFMAFLLKHRNVTMPGRQLPLADMPPSSRAHETPLVKLHPLAPNRTFNMSAVLGSIVVRTEFLSTNRPQVCACFWALVHNASQDRLICQRFIDVCCILASAAFCNTYQLKQVHSFTLCCLTVQQGLRFSNIMSLESRLLLQSDDHFEFVTRLCENNARWGKAVNSHAELFERWSAELITKHSKMPNLVEVLKCVTNFINEPRRLLCAPSTCYLLCDSIGKLVAPGVISAMGSPHRVFCVLAVAVCQLCFAYNLLPPVEIPGRALLRSDRSPLPIAMPFSDTKRHFPLMMGHDALRHIVQHEVLGLPPRIVRCEDVSIKSTSALESHVVVVPGVVWEQPNHWPRVLKLLNDSAVGCATRLVVFLGGNECPFGFVRVMTTSVLGGAARLNLPEEMDCTEPSIAVPAGVWSACPVEVSSFSNANMIYGLKPTDHVLVVNALQVLPCILEHLVTAGRVAHCRLALGALPPVAVRFCPVTKLTAMLLSRASSAPTEPSTEPQRQCLRPMGIPCDSAALQALGGTLFSHSAARLDCAGYTTTWNSLPQSILSAAVSQLPTPFPASLCVPGALGVKCKLADLLFLPRIVHPCVKHKCVVLVDVPCTSRETARWIDTAWGNIDCVATEGVTKQIYQSPWQPCFADVEPQQATTPATPPAVSKIIVE